MTEEVSRPASYNKYPVRLEQKNRWQRFGDAVYRLASKAWGAIERTGLGNRVGRVAPFIGRQVLEGLTAEATERWARVDSAALLRFDTWIDWTVRADHVYNQITPAVVRQTPDGRVSVSALPRLGSTSVDGWGASGRGIGVMVDRPGTRVTPAYLVEASPPVPERTTLVIPAELNVASDYLNTYNTRQRFTEMGAVLTRA